MDVFDSSLWLAALLTDAPEPDQYLQEVLDGDREVAIGPYIHEEVTRNIERADRPRSAKDAAQATFNDTVADLNGTRFPTYRELSRTSVEEARARPEVQLLHEVLGIQSKDVPVPVFAYSLVRGDLADSVTVYTLDGDFASLDTTAAGIPDVSVAGVSIT